MAAAIDCLIKDDLLTEDLKGNPPLAVELVSAKSLPAWPIIENYPALARWITLPPAIGAATSSGSSFTLKSTVEAIAALAITEPCTSHTVAAFDVGRVQIAAAAISSGKRVARERQVLLVRRDHHTEGPGRV